MPGKGINGRANMQKFQMNSKKYGGNPFKYTSLVSSVGRASKGGMWNSIQRRAEPKAPVVAAWAPQFVDKDLNDLVATTTAVNQGGVVDNFYNTQTNSNNGEWLEITLPQTYYISRATATMTSPLNAYTDSYIYFNLDGVPTGWFHNNVNLPPLGPNITETETDTFEPPIAVNSLKLNSWWNPIILDSLKLTGSTIAP